MRRHLHLFLLGLLLLSLTLAGCSTTSHLPEGETLYTGIHQITYLGQGQKPKKIARDTTGVIISIADAAKRVDNLLHGSLEGAFGSADSLKTGRHSETKLSKAEAQALETAAEEVNAVLEIAPNNSLFGSAYHRTPFPIGLWAYNRYVNKPSGFAKWMYRSFASEPVLITSVNPATRIKVATNTLHNYGFFHGNVKYVIEPKGNRKAKMNYFVTPGRVFTLDSIAYRDFPPVADSLIRHSRRESFLRKGDAFSVAKLTSEQSRLEKLFRNDGYYFYRANSATYKADTLVRPYKVQLVMQPKEGLPPLSRERWYIGNTYITVRNSDQQQATNIWSRHGLNIIYSGSKIPLRPIVWMQNIAHRPHSLYRQDDQEKTQEMLSSLGIFSSLSLSYQRRDSLALLRDSTSTAARPNLRDLTVKSGQDTLDLYIDAVLDKPYTSDIEVNVTEKNGDRLGPGLTFSLQRKNAFRGAELLNFKLYGNYEWRINGENTRHNSLFNSYEIGTQISADYPYIVFPGINRRTFRFPTATSFSLTADWLNRAGYFNLFSSGIDVTYSWHRNTTSRHQLIPFSFKYDKLISSTHEFDSIMSANPALYSSMRDRFVPSMQYTYTYMESATVHRNPLWWQLSVKEAGNITSGIYALCGRKLSEKNKNLFHNPFAQYVKVTSELHNTFRIDRTSQIVTRLMGGIIYSYGNTDYAPYSDQFFVGGANSIRAFQIRTIGPGHYYTPKSKYSYMDQTGDIKLEANAEYRFQLFGSLHGALFVDAGNVWLLRDNDLRPGGTFQLKHFLSDIALGTGCGLRYDMDFLVLRLDLGIAIHDPADNHRSGYYNIKKFTDGLALHFAIGYPF